MISSYLVVVFSTLFINNIVLIQLLGINTLLEKTGSIKQSISVTIATSMVLLVSTCLLYFIDKYIIVAYDIEFLRTFIYVVVIISVSQFFYVLVQKVFQKLTIFFQRNFIQVSVSSLVLGVPLVMNRNEFDFIESLLLAVSASLAFGVGMVIVAGIRYQLQFASIPKAMRGTPILLIILGLLAMAFLGFSGA